MTAGSQPDHPDLGRLEVICGPMFSGKTTRLISRLRDAAGRGLSVEALKPALDDRYHPTDITTHDDTAFPARVIHAPVELRSARGAVVGLDEAHFFETGLHEAVLDLVSRGVSVVIAGLDRTSFNEPFGEMARLLIEADEVVKLSAPCAVCGRPAVHTIRLIPSTERIVVGGPGMFENRCRAHLHHPPPAGQQGQVPREPRR